MNEQELTGLLQECSLHALLIITARMLGRLGFGDVELQDRRLTRQKSRRGGHEIACESFVAGRPYRTIVKVINDVGRQRMLDELAGSAIRLNADRAILVTPHRLTRNATKNLGNYFGVRVEAIAGTALAKCLMQTRVGVRSSGSVDYAFFGELEAVTKRIQAFMKEEAYAR